jgi:hypothetical protein
MDSIIEFFYNYLQGEINRVTEILSDIKSPFYTWFFLLIFIKIYRKLNNI